MQQQPNDLLITLIQTSLHWEDPAANRQMFSKHFDSIKEETHVIVLPEMFSTGFTMNAKTVAEKMDGQTVLWMTQEAKRKKCVITGSLLIEEAGNYFNRLFWMNPDGDFLTYDKRHLFRLSGEEKVFTAGNKKIIVELNGWKICPLVCYDLRFPVWSRRTAEADYDVLIYAANWPQKRIYAWNQLLPARAIENQSYVIGVNRWGNDGNNAEHPGCSAAIDFKGEKLNRNESGEFIETVSLSFEALQQFRNHFAFHRDADTFRLENGE